MTDRLNTGDGDAAFRRAIARGFLVYEPESAMNNVYFWRYAGHDEQGNTWFGHVRDDVCLVMPPEERPDEARRAKVVPFPLRDSTSGGRQ